MRPLFWLHLTGLRPGMLCGLNASNIEAIEPTLERRGYRATFRPTFINWCENLSRGRRRPRDFRREVAGICPIGVLSVERLRLRDGEKIALGQLAGRQNQIEVGCGLSGRGTVFSGDLPGLAGRDGGMALK